MKRAHYFMIKQHIKKHCKMSQNLVFFGCFHLSREANGNSICQLAGPNLFNEQRYKKKSYLFEEW